VVVVVVVVLLPLLLLRPTTYDASPASFAYGALLRPMLGVGLATEPL
jgi:hypothetical protein